MSAVLIGSPAAMRMEPPIDPPAGDGDERSLVASFDGIEFDATVHHDEGSCVLTSAAIAGVELLDLLKPSVVRALEADALDTIERELRKDEEDAAASYLSEREFDGAECW